MNRNSIDELLRKFWEGETSLEEERILKQHFAEIEDFQSSKEEAEYFAQIAEFKEIEVDPIYKGHAVPFKADSHERPKKRLRLIKPIGVAALLAVTLSIAKFSFDQIRLKKEQEFIKLVNDVEKDLVEISNSLNEGYQDPNVAIIEKR